MTSFDKHSFLVVDDEAFSRAMVSQMLKRAGAAEVLVAENGADAIAMLNTLPVTVMITDFRMPGLHGLQLLQKVRTGQTQAPRNLTCAMLTGHAVRHLVGMAIVLDVDAFLAKPVSLETLTKHLHRSFQYRFEPLPSEEYEKVDVSHADAFLTGQAEGASPITPIPLPDGPLPLDEDDRPTRPTTNVTGARLDLGAVRPEKSGPKPAAKPPVKGPTRPGAPVQDEIRVALNEVPERAVLTRDIIGASGTLLLAAGTPFRSRYVRRLQELRDLEGDISHIWIRPA